jgi:hypothetical protein
MLPERRGTGGSLARLAPERALDDSLAPPSLDAALRRVLVEESVDRLREDDDLVLFHEIGPVDFQRRHGVSSLRARPAAHACAAPPAILVAAPEGCNARVLVETPVPTQPCRSPTCEIEE